MAELVEWLFLAGRLVFGGFFVINGLDHLVNLDHKSEHAAAQRVPAPRVVTAGSGALLLLGGTGVVTGLFPHASLGLLIAFLVVANLGMHRFWTIEDPSLRARHKNAFHRNLALLGACLALFVVRTPWVLSL